MMNDDDDDDDNDSDNDEKQKLPQNKSPPANMSLLVCVLLLEVSALSKCSQKKHCTVNFRTHKDVSSNRVALYFLYFSLLFVL